MYKRTSFLKEVFWHKGVAVVLAFYSILQLVFNIIGWTTPPETQAKYQLIKIVQFFSWQTWLIGLLTIVAVMVTEGSYRTVKKREIELAKKNEFLNARTASEIIQTELLTFWLAGDKLFNEINDMPPNVALPVAQVEEWISQSESFLQTKFRSPMNELYLRMFREDAGITQPVGVFGQTPHAKLRARVESHKYQLARIHALVAIRHLGAFG